MAGGFSGGTAFDGNWNSVAFRRNGTALNLLVDGTMRRFDYCYARHREHVRSNDLDAPSIQLNVFLRQG